MQTSLSFSSLQASYTTTHWSLGEEITNNQANSVPQISDEGGNSQKASNVMSSTELLNAKLGDFQKQVINQALGKIAEIQNEVIKVWEEVFGVSSGKSSSSSNSSLSLESLLNGNFSRPTYNVGSGMSITQGFSQSLELSIQGTIVGKDGVSRKLDLSISMSQSFVQNLQINSQNTASSGSSSNSNKVIDPLVIDYAGNGTELSDTKMSFDLDSDGKKDQISTLKEGSGFLALDKNGDGTINDGNELFGTQSGDGFKDLSAYDSNSDGKIDKDDPIYDKLRIWTPNEKGEGELVGLGEKGIGVIYLDAKENQEMMRGEEGDLLGIKQKTSNFTREDGSSGEIHHIDLVAENPVNSAQNASNASLQEGLQIAASRAYLQNLSFSFSISQSSGSIWSGNQASQGSFSTFSFSAAQYSFSLSSLESANNGVSKELSAMWKGLQETFLGFESKEKTPSLFDKLLERFDERFADLNRFVFESADVEESLFRGSLGNNLQKLLAA